MDEEQVRAQLVERLGIGELPAEEQDNILGDVTEALLQRIMYATMARLSEDDQKILLEKMEDEQATEADIDTFLRSAIEDYDDFIAKTTEGFFADMAAFQEEELSSGGDAAAKLVESTEPTKPIESVEQVKPSEPTA